jgi:hypothetical protein
MTMAMSFLLKFTFKLGVAHPQNSKVCVSFGCDFSTRKD